MVDQKGGSLQVPTLGNQENLEALDQGRKGRIGKKKGRASAVKGIEIFL